jgi:hypothetical protein
MYHYVIAQTRMMNCIHCASAPHSVIVSKYIDIYNSHRFGLTRTEGGCLTLIQIKKNRRSDVDAANLVLRVPILPSG